MTSTPLESRLPPSSEQLGSGASWGGGTPGPTHTDARILSALGGCRGRWAGFCAPRAGRAPRPAPDSTSPSRLRPSLVLPRPLCPKPRPPRLVLRWKPRPHSPAPEAPACLSRVLLPQKPGPSQLRPAPRSPRLGAPGGAGGGAPRLLCRARAAARAHSPRRPGAAGRRRAHPPRRAEGAPSVPARRGARPRAPPASSSAVAAPPAPARAGAPR